MTPDTRDKAYAICDQIAAGGAKSKLHRACADHGMSWQQFWHLKADDAELAARYAHARSLAAQWWRDHAGTVAEDATPETVQVAKLQHDNAKWQAVMADRQEFGEQRQAAVTVNIASLHLDSLRRIAQATAAVVAPQLTQGDAAQEDSALDDADRAE